MSVIIFLLILCSIAQFVFCHFSLWVIIVLIDRLLFACRIVGATFKVKSLAICEGVALGAMVLFNMMFASESFPWLRILLFAVFSSLSVLLMYIDDVFYVYVVEDDDEYEEE